VFHQSDQHRFDNSCSLRRGSLRVKIEKEHLRKRHLTDQLIGQSVTSYEDLVAGHR
jgi:hypothetical protein